MRKPINFLIANMAISDLLSSIFVIPPEIQMLYIDSWLIGGPLGQALCKLTYFLTNVSTAVSIQSLVLIAVDRFGAVVYALRSPLTVQSCAHSSFSPLGSSRWLVTPHISSPSNLLITKEGWLVACGGMKPLKSTCPSRIT